MRVMRSTLLLLISMVLATNIVWAAQAVAAWHRGLGQSASSQQQLLLQRLNNTTLSVEVRHRGTACMSDSVLLELFAGGAPMLLLLLLLLLPPMLLHTSALVQVSRVGAGEGEHSTYVVNAQLVDRDSSGQASSASKQEAAGAAAAVAASDAPNKREEEQPQQQQHVQDQQEQQAIGGGLVAQLKGVGSALGLIAPIKDGGGPLFVPNDSKAQAEASPQPPQPPPHRCGTLPFAVTPARLATSMHAELFCCLMCPPIAVARRAILKMPEVEENSSDTCAQASVAGWLVPDPCSPASLHFVLCLLAVIPTRWPCACLAECRRCNCPRSHCFSLPGATSTTTKLGACGLKQACKLWLQCCGMLCANHILCCYFIPPQKTLYSGDESGLCLFASCPCAARDMLPSKQLRDAACPTAAAPADEMATGQQQPEEMLGGPAQEPQQGLGHAQTAASAVAAACGWDAAAARQMSTGSGSAIQQQHLYSVYIHAPPDIQGARSLDQLCCVLALLCHRWC